jgi:hypothetical protein
MMSIDGIPATYQFWIAFPFYELMWCMSIYIFTCWRQTWIEIEVEIERTCDFKLDWWLGMNENDLLPKSVFVSFIHPWMHECIHSSIHSSIYSLTHIHIVRQVRHVPALLEVWLRLCVGTCPRSLFWSLRDSPRGLSWMKTVSNIHTYINTYIHTYIHTYVPLLQQTKQSADF